MEGAEEWLSRWQLEDQPSPEAVEFAEGWLRDLDGDPRQYPSAEASWPIPHGQGELRTAFLLDADAFVVYVLRDDGDRVLWLSGQPPGDVTFRVPN